MEHINRIIIIIIIIITLMTLVLSCSHKQRTTGISQEDATLFSLTTYRNIYNKYGKLDTVFTSEEIFSIVSSSFSKELHYMYKNDTVLLREEEYDILPNGKKIMTSSCIYDENTEKYYIFTNKDTVRQGNILYENGQIISERTIDVREYSKENSEIIFSYDSENRVSQIKTMDYDDGITIIENYKYDIINDTLVTYIYVDNMLRSTEKKIGKDNCFIDFFYNNQNHLVRLTTHTQTDSKNNLSVEIDYEFNQLDSTFYYLDRKVKTIITPLKKDSSPDVGSIDKSKRYTIDELVDIFASPMNKQTILFEYDEFGNLTKEEVWYE